MKTKITGRELKFFFLGVFTIILIDLVWNWDNNKIKEGFNEHLWKTDSVK
ncbi:MAG: hypothetical protein Q7U54_20115 [Bacteroidales bacterium]|nr:hypothetical protein [Bacteroidales bacterium]